MVRSRPVLIFVALGAALLATAAPLRLAPSVEPASQEAASCAHFDQDIPESVNPHDCSEIELNVSSGEHYVLDMDSFPFSRDSSGIVPLPPFDSRSSQEHVDADAASVPSVESRAPYPSGSFDSPLGQERVVAVTVNVPERADADHTASVPGIASHAPHPSGPFHSLLIQDHVDTDDTSALSIESHASYPSAPFHSLAIQERADADDAASLPGLESRAPHTSDGIPEVLRRSIGVLSSGTSNTPDSHPLPQKRTDTDIAGDDDNAPLALHIPVTLQPTSAVDTSSPSEATSPDQRTGAHEEEDLEHETIITTHSIVSHVPDSSGPLCSSSGSDDRPLLRERSNINIASPHSIETHSSGKPSPLVVSSPKDPSTFQFVAELEADQDLVQAVLDFIKSKQLPYFEDVQASTNYDRFVQTKTGQLCMEIDRLLAELHPSFDRVSVKNTVMTNILKAHLNPNAEVDARRLLEKFKTWNPTQYRKDIEASEYRSDFHHTESGRLLGMLFGRIRGLQGKPKRLQRFDLQNLVDKDIRDIKAPLFPGGTTCPDGAV
ncbi:hypothetical protein FB446DRAFT_699396 [Lentinula raphanica]|nr:hypothetical protein FB446DRAFT_699396 [Lentinula raphanica]